MFVAATTLVGIVEVGKSYRAKVKHYVLMYYVLLKGKPPVHLHENPAVFGAAASGGRNEGKDFCQARLQEHFFIHCQ